jgi:CRP/FNR family cyclic AMP-dependent transcriptional regulator
MRYGLDVWCDGGFRAVLPGDLWDTLASLGTRRTYATGQHLMTEGETDTRVIVLVEGRVKVTCTEDDGTEVLLSIRGAGDVVGERAAIDRGVRSATVTALRHCSARVLSAREFMGFVRQHDLADAMLRFGVSRQREGQAIRVEISTLPVARRLVRTLLRLAEAFDDHSGGAVAIDIGIPQEELAHAIGASRSQLAVHLARLRAEGIVATGSRRIVVLDPARLRAADAGH